MLLGGLLGALPGCACRGSSPAVSEAPPAPDWLTDISAAVGLDFVQESGARGEYFMPEIMGGGAALFDYDGDGDLDVYLTNGNRELPAPGVSAELTNRLFRREAGGRYVDVTAGSGLAHGGYGMGVAVGDVDNDGDVDVYLTNYGPDALFRNRGDGSFEEITSAAAIDVAEWSASAVFSDYDRDGHLDLYVTRYVAYVPTPCMDLTGRPDYCGPQIFRSLPDVLHHNRGDGTFEDVSARAGIGAVAASGLGVVSEDLDGDGWPDFYVANDGDPNNLWLNRHDGTFRDDGVVLGVAVNLSGQSEAGMGVIAADLSGDAILDLFVTHLREESNTYYLNLGGGLGFTDATGESGLGPSSMPYTGFGTAALDLDLDGDLDLVVGNGSVHTAPGVSAAAADDPLKPLAEPNLVYLNDGAGHFELLESGGGGFTRELEITRALAVGDIDADGDLDILIANVQGRARLYRNDAPRTGHWLSVRALDPRLERDAIGARVTVVAAGRTILRTVTAASSYLSANEPRAHFGLGAVGLVDGFEVAWPDGLRESFGGTPADRAVTLVRGTGRAQAP